VWNRVVLLLCGISLGWNLVDYFVLPSDRARRYGLRALVSGAVGVAVSVWLVPASGLAGLTMGLTVLALSAFLAYAGHAREISRVEEPLPRALPERSSTAEPRTAVVLVADGEPDQYDGPGAWAPRFRRREAAGRPVPGWLSRPRALARVRSVYERLPAEDRAGAFLNGVAGRLESELGEGYVCCAALSDGPPSLASVIAHLAEAGHRRVLLIVCDDDPGVATYLRDEVTRSRVRELGVVADVLLPGGGEALASLQEQRWCALLAGLLPPTLEGAEAPLVERAAAAVRAAAAEGSRCPRPR